MTQLSEKAFEKLYERYRENRPFFYVVTYQNHSLTIYYTIVSENKIIEADKEATIKTTWKINALLESLRSLYRIELERIEWGHESPIETIEVDWNAIGQIINDPDYNPEDPIMYLNPFEASRFLVALKLLQSTKNLVQGDIVLKIVADLSDEDIHYWSWKIREKGNKAVGAFKKLFL